MLSLRLVVLVALAAAASVAAAAAASNPYTSTTFAPSVSGAGAVSVDGDLLLSSTTLFSCTTTGACTPTFTLPSTTTPCSVALANGLAVLGNCNEANGCGGAVYLFVCTNSTSCTSTGSLSDPDGSDGDQYGSALAIDGSSGLLAIGAVSKTYNYISLEGGLYVFQCSFSAGSCSQVGNLLVTGQAGTQLGSSAAVLGTTVFAGAMGQGAVHVFDCSSLTTCVEETPIVPSGSSSSTASFGASIAASGLVLVVGAPSGETVFVFVYSPSSFSATQLPDGVLTASDGGTNDAFGWAVGLTATNIVVVGAPFNLDRGAVYVYDCGTTLCAQQYKLTAADGQSGDQYGKGIALDDGTGLLAVMAPDHPATGEGYSYTCPIGSFGAQCTNCSLCLHGNCSDTDTGIAGTCICADGWMGPLCDQPCNAGFYGPQCSLNCSTCQSGVCSSGQCTCNNGWAGLSCNVCDDVSFGPNCTSCSLCQHGLCTTGLAGSCACSIGWAEPLCSNCTAGYYGPQCLSCSATCNQANTATCEWGIQGQCACKHGWGGPTCDLPTCCNLVTGAPIGGYQAIATMTSLNTSISLQCGGCGSELTTLGNFSSLVTVADDVTIEIVCSNCSALSSLGLFPALATAATLQIDLACEDCPALVDVALLAPTATAIEAVSLSCTDCPALVTLDQLPQVQTVGNALALTCTDCPLLASLGSSLTALVGTSQPPSTVQIACSSCASVASLGASLLSNFTELTSTTANVTCTDCPSLTTISVFDGLTTGAAPYATVAVSLACTDCPALTTLGDYTGLVSALNPSGSGAAVTIELTCVNCTSLEQLAVFSNLTSLATTQFDVATAAISASCTDCPALVTLGAFPSLTSIASAANPGGVDLANTATGSIALQCTQCAGLATIGLFGSLATVAAAANDVDIGSVGAIGSLSIDCVQCGNVTAFSTFPVLQSLAVGQSDAAPSLSSTIAVSAAAQVALTCTQCEALQSIAPADQLAALAVVDPWTGATAALVVQCESCPQVTTLGSFAGLAALGTSTNAPLLLSTHQLQATLQLSCVDCAAIEAVGSFAALQALITTSSPSAFDIVALDVSCTSCPSATAIGLLPALASLSTNGPISISCTSCASLATLGALPSLSAAPPGSALNLLCATCPLLSTMTLADPPQVVSPETASLLCDGCSTTGPMTLSLPLNYVFTGAVPPSIAFVDNAAYAFVDTALPASLVASFAQLHHIASLGLVGVTGPSNLDSLVPLLRVDGEVLIQDCLNLTNVDGLVANLASVASVSIVGNPLLCNVPAQTLQALASVSAQLSNNGGGVNCTLALPVAPARPVLVQLLATLATVNVTLPVLQPSVLVTYQLLLNGAPVLSFPSWQPPAAIDLPVQLGPLTASTVYTVLLTAQLGAHVASSIPLVFTTLPPPIGPCAQPGWVPVTAANPSACAPCPAGSFASADAQACVPCPAGTVSNATAATSSATCAFCPPIATYASNNTCVPCGPSAGVAYYCPLGVANGPIPVNVSTTVAVILSDFAASEDEDNLGPSFNIGSLEHVDVPDLIVFVLVVVLIAIGLFVAIFYRCGGVKGCIASFDVFLIQPTFLLEADRTTYAVRRVKQVSRGLFGLFVFVCVIAATTYQSYEFAYGHAATQATLQSNTVALTAQTSFYVIVELIASPITCDSVVADAAILEGNLN